MNKEWKGNKKSVSTMLGMSTTWHPEQRAAGDYYTTDPAAVREFLNQLSAEYIDGQTVWEPACGCGNISEVLKQYGANVVSTDLYDRGYGQSGVDFLLTNKVPDGCKLIITNPPYSLSDQFILHAMKLLPMGGVYCALLNISYLAGKKRYRHIYEDGFLAKVYIYPHRINCWKNNEQTKHSSPVNYAWFVFKKGYIGQPEICWIY